MTLHNQDYNMIDDQKMNINDHLLVKKFILEQGKHLFIINVYIPHDQQLKKQVIKDLERIM